MDLPRRLIVNCDDLGSSRAANVAIYEALRDGVATCATLMVPCPWARDAAAIVTVVVTETRVRSLPIGRMRPPVPKKAAR